MKKWTKLFSLALGALMAIGAAVGVKKTAERVSAETTWERVTTIATLTGGGTFIMGYEDAAKSGVIVPLRSADCNAKTTANGYFNTGTTAGSSTSGTIDMSKVDQTSDFEVYISSPASGKINIQMKDDNGSFYGATSGGSTKNSGRLYANGNSAETNLTPEFSSEGNNQFKLTSDVSNQYKYLKYNTGSPRFAYYNSAGSNIVFYKKVSSYTITFDSNGGSSVQSQKVNENSTVTKPNNPTCDGYNFDGWYLDNGTFANPYDFSTPVTSSFTLYAKWSSSALSIEEKFVNVSTMASLSFSYVESTIKTAQGSIDADFSNKTTNTTNADGRNVNMLNAIIPSESQPLFNSVTRAENQSGTLPGIGSAGVFTFYSSKPTNENRHGSVSFDLKVKVESVIVTYPESQNLKLSLVISDNVIGEIENNTEFPVNSSNFTLQNCNPGDGAAAGNTKVAINSLTINYAIEGTGYSDFADFKIQMRYDYDLKDEKIDECGIVVTSSNFDFSSNKYNTTKNDANELLNYAKTNSLNLKKFKNDVKDTKSDFTVGIKISSIDDCNKKLYASAYIVVEGKYYFAKGINYDVSTSKANGFSVLTMCETYLGMGSVSDENKSILRVLVNEIKNV